MGRQGDRQGDLMVMWSEMPRSPGHVFYDRRQEVLVGAGFDGFVEDTCRAFYAKAMGAPSVPPGRYCRMHMVGYFEGIEWRCAAGRSASPYVTWPASAASSDAAAIYWAISSAIGMRWCPMRAGIGAESRSRRRSWRARSTRSWPSA